MKRSTWAMALRAAMIAVLTLSGTASVASADPPPLLPIQGYLTNSSSEPLDGTHQIRFRLYDADAAGNALFEETLDVNVAEGFFTIYLGDTEPLDLALFRTNANVYLGIKVGTDAEAEPRLQLATTAFASLAAFCGDADTVGGLEPDAFQTRVVGTCAGGQFMQTIDEDGNVSCASPAAEADPQVGTLEAGGLCFSNGTAVNCTGETPLFAEVDPKIGTLVSNSWCTSNGSAINCNTAAPIVTEADPQVGTLVNNNWCTSNGTAINCNVAPPITAEADPQVSTTSTKAVPRWDGAQLVNGRITDTGALVGVNNAAPGVELDVGGSVEVTVDYRYASPRTFNTWLGAAAFNPMSAADLDVWSERANGYGYMNDSAGGASSGGSLMLADLTLPEDSVITAAACYYYDNTTGAGLGYTLTIPSTGAMLPFNTSFSLYRRGAANVASELLFTDEVTTTSAGTATTPTSLNWIDTSVNVTGADVVDNTNYDYFMYVAWNVSDDFTENLRFYGCRVTYTMTVLGAP